MDKRKRLLYDLSPIPESVQESSDGYRYDLEVRVVLNKAVIEEIHSVKSSFSIGTDIEADYPIDESIFDEEMFELVKRAGDSAVLKLKNDFKGYLVRGEEKEEISSYVASGRDEFEIEKSCFAVVEFGEISIVAMMTPKGKLRAAPLMSNLDVTTSVILFLTFFVGLFSVNSILELPPIEVDILDLSDAELIDVFPIIEDPEVEPFKDEPKIKIKPKKGLAEAETTKASLGEEGRVGKKESRVANAQGSARKRLTEEKAASSSGIMGALASGARSFDRVFGGGGLGAGLEKNLGMVTGLSGADMFGSAGLGLKGHGIGGGGNLLGIGGLGGKRKGIAGGNPTYGMGAASNLEKPRSVIRAGGGGAVMMGALDRAVIDGYIRRNLAKIRWCYEKELGKNPNLFGKIVINFKIKKSGRVGYSNVKRTTMGSPKVEKCVARQIKQIRFPKPNGGGIVIVNYPFVFKNSSTS